MLFLCINLYFWCCGFPLTRNSNFDGFLVCEKLDTRWLSCLGWANPQNYWGNLFLRWIYLHNLVNIMINKMESIELKFYNYVCKRFWILSSELPYVLRCVFATMMCIHSGKHLFMSIILAITGLQEYLYLHLMMIKLSWLSKAVSPTIVSKSTTKTLLSIPLFMHWFQGTQ